MKESIKKYWWIILIIIIAVIWFVQDYQKTENWTLSLYSNGITTLRLNFDSRKLCMSNGINYVEKKSADRFDCGLNCEDSIDLTRGILCEQVCDKNICRK